MIHARILLLITTAAATIATRLIMVVRIPTPIIMLVLVYLTQLIITSGMPMPSSSIKISSPASSSSSSSSLLRIIAGTEADELRYPYVVSISQYPDAPNFCGGSFIAPDVVLSAAHCNCALYHGNSSTCQIAVGRNNISTPFYGDDDGETIFYEKEIIHPNFNPASLLPESSVIPDYDFNLIFLNDTISENSTVASNYMTYIQINDNAAIPQSGEELTIVGWGDTIQDIYLNATSTVLMEATEFVVTNTVCEQSKGYVQNLIYESYEGKITDNMLCSQKDGTGACQGDSGGPLIKKGSDESGADDVLVGIVSWGYGCGEQNFPGVYSRVSAQYEWIQSNVCSFSKYPPDWFNCKDAAPALPPSVSSVLPDPEEGKTNILIQVTLDGNPIETGWRLTTLSEEEGVEGVILLGMPVGSYVESDANQTYQYEIMIDSEQFYNMTVFDSMGDTFEGSVIVADETTPDLLMLMHEPGFISSTSESQAFYPGYTPERFLTLRFVFDDYPEELSFMISNDANDITFALMDSGTFDNSTLSATINVPIYGPSKGDQAYKLYVWDSGDDGMCCQYGAGSFELYLGDPDAGGTLLISGNGEYGDEGIYPFTVTRDSSISDSPSLIPCPFCEKKSVLDDVEIPGSPGITCEFTAFSATLIDASSDECTGLALAELDCCPDDDIQPPESVESDSPKSSMATSFFTAITAVAHFAIAY